MKKRNIICIVVVAVLLVIGIIVLDLFKTIEKESSNLDYTKNGLVGAYNFEEKDNQIVLTLYSSIPVRCVVNYTFDKEMLQSTRHTNYYTTKMEALFYYFESFVNNEKYSNVKLKGNSISYDMVTKESEEISKQDILVYIENTFGSLPKV